MAQRKASQTRRYSIVFGRGPLSNRGALIRPSTLRFWQYALYNYTTGATNRTLAYHEANEWLLGYASGLNAARPAASGADPLLTINSANLLTFVEAYCKTNPEHSIIKGVDDWFKALSK